MPSSPLDTLPTEIIQKIFLSCLGDKTTFLPPKTNDIAVQLVISQVCSSWQSIALATPQLWDNFILSLDNNHRAESALRLASLWLDHAAGSAVTLEVRTNLLDDSPSIHELHRLISSHRFKSLAGSLELCWIPLNNKACEHSFTFLDSLLLDIPAEFQHGQLPVGKLIANDYCQLPSLRYLRIHPLMGNLRSRDPLYMIPWHQLNTLELHNVNRLSTVVEIMQECKALRKCNLLWSKRISYNAGVLFPACPRLLPSLCSVELYSPSPIAYIAKILFDFNLPNLTSLALRSCALWFDRFAPGTDWLSSQSPSPLDALLRQLQEFEYSDSHNILDVRTALIHMPSLLKITLRGNVSLDDDTAEQISTGELGRHIHTFSFKFCCSVELLLDMIEKRQDNANQGRDLTPFIRVGFRCPAALHDKYKERAEQLECQHNVRIEMEPGFAEMGDDYSREDSEQED